MSKAEALFAHTANSGISPPHGSWLAATTTILTGRYDEPLN